MKKILSVFLLGAVFLFSSCSGQFLGGAGTGVLGTGAGYEYHLNQQMKQVEEDYKAGRIEESEYNIRKDQIQKDSLIQ